MEIDIKESRHCGHVLAIRNKWNGITYTSWKRVYIGQSIEEVELVVDELTLYLEQIKQPTAAELECSWPSSGVER